MEYTKRIADFVASTRYGDIPAGALVSAKQVIMDNAGTAVAGSQDEAGSIAAEIAREEGAREEASVFGQGFRTSSATAALTNGLSAHALDFDASFDVGGQPMAGLAAPVF